MSRFNFIFVLLVFSQNALLGNSTASRVAGGIVNTQGVPWDNQVTDKGREYALEASQRDANTGAIMAGITGAALASAATGYFLAGDFATGSALMGMAGLEFAQMAASGKDSNTNRMQKEVLLQTQPNGNMQLDLNKEKEKWKAELPNGLDNFLRQRGVDPDTFKDLVFDGKVTDQQSVLNAVGIESKGITVSDLELGAGKAQAQLEDVFQKARATFDSQYAGQLGNSTNQKEHSAPDQFSKNGDTIEPPERKRKPTQVTKNEENFTVPPSLVSSYYGLPDGSFTPQEMTLLTESYLREQGILPGRQGRNIFQLANDGYKTFSKSLTRSR